MYVNRGPGTSDVNDGNIRKKCLDMVRHQDGDITLWDGPQDSLGNGCDLGNQALGVCQ